MVIFLCGTPGAGKSSFGEYLEKNQGFLHINMEHTPWSDESIHPTWDLIFQFPNDDTKVKEFVNAVKKRNNNTVLDLGFVINNGYFRIIKLLQKNGCKVVWFDCEINVAKKRWQKRNPQAPIQIFERQIQDINDNWQKIINEINPLVINVLADEKNNIDNESLYKKIK